MYKIEIYHSGLSYAGFGQYATSNEHIKTIHSNSIQEAKKELKKACKQYKLKRQLGVWGNSQTGIEAAVNY